MCDSQLARALAHRCASRLARHLDMPRCPKDVGQFEHGCTRCMCWHDSDYRETRDKRQETEMRKPSLLVVKRDQVDQYQYPAAEERNLQWSRVRDCVVGAGTVFKATGLLYVLHPLPPLLRTPPPTGNESTRNDSLTERTFKPSHSHCCMILIVACAKVIIDTRHTTRDEQKKKGAKKDMTNKTLEIDSDARLSK